MRELLRVADLCLDLRLFLGYGLGERPPAYRTISEAQRQRFAEGGVFERLFLRTVALCEEQGLIEGSYLSVDGFRAEGKAALRSLRAGLEPVADGAGEAPEHDRAEPAEPPQLRLAEPRRGERRDGKPRMRPPSRPVIRTRVGRASPDSGRILSPAARSRSTRRSAVSPAAWASVRGGDEGDALAPLLDRVRFLLAELASVGADQGFAAERVWEDAPERRLVVYIPSQRTMLPGDGRTPRTNAQRPALEARARARSEAGIWAHRRRMADAEGAIAELKSLHGPDRVRCHGTPAFHAQLLLGCATINQKRLAKHAPLTQERVAAAPDASTTAPSIDHDPHQRTNQRPPIRFNGPDPTWTVHPSLN